MKERIFKIGGVFAHQHIRNGKVIGEWEEDSNIVVNEGLNYILDAALSGGTQTTAFYLGLFKNNYTPIATNVASTFSGAGVANEATTEYSESVRPQWIEVGPSSQIITNSASPAVFTFASNISIYGALLATLSTKATASGKLIAASKFSAVRSMITADVLNVTYTLTISST
jgi:hypothetical protein